MFVCAKSTSSGVGSDSVLSSLRSSFSSESFSLGMSSVFCSCSISEGSTFGGKINRSISY
jgi:hypothetical protein